MRLIVFRWFTKLVTLFAVCTPLEYTVLRLLPLIWTLLRNHWTRINQMSRLGLIQILTQMHLIQMHLTPRRVVLPQLILLKASSHLWALPPLQPQLLCQWRRKFQLNQFWSKSHLFWSPPMPPKENSPLPKALVLALQFRKNPTPIWMLLKPMRKVLPKLNMCRLCWTNDYPCPLNLHLANLHRSLKSSGEWLQLLNCQPSARFTSCCIHVSLDRLDHRKAPSGSHPNVLTVVPFLACSLLESIFISLVCSYIS